MKANKENILLSCLLFFALAAAFLMTPSIKQSEKGPKFKLEEIIPEKFGDWELKTDLMSEIVAPDVKVAIEKIYNQTLTRTYTNSRGDSVMLSIAYGGNQASEDMQVHRPEYCYAAQGFEVNKIKRNTIKTNYGTVNVNRIVASLGSRNEPITYWLTIGNKSTLPGIERKLIQLKYGLSGVIPDGVLVRLSSLSHDTQNAYKLHDYFFNALINAVDQKDHVRLIGKH